MVVKCKEEVYSWFQNCDSSNRVDFICTLLRNYCSPWEIRFFGTCIEQLARKSHHIFQDYDFNNKTDYQALQEHMLQSEVRILDQTEHISRLIMALCILRSRPPDSLCSSIPYVIIMEISKNLRDQLSRVPPTTEAHKQLIWDVRLLLAIAMHHPAFSFDQHKDFLSQLNEIKVRLKHWSYSVDECDANMIDVQCQTDSTQVDEIKRSAQHTASQTKAVTTDAPRTDSYSTHTSKQYHISDLTLKTKRTTKSDVKYKIEVVSYTNTEQHTIEKSLQDIKAFHDKMLEAFPEDVKSPKQVRNVPLFKAVDTSEAVISRYLKDLCRMKKELLDSQPMRDFFLVQTSPSSSLSQPIKDGSSAKDTSISESIATDETAALADEDGGMSECDDLSLPIHSLIVTNSSKYPISVPSVKSTASSHCRATMTSTASSHPLSNQMLQMTKDDLKAKGMVEGAARKLRDNLDSVDRSSGQMNVQVSCKLANVKSGTHHSPLSCDSSSSDVASPITSPSRPGIHKSMQSMNHQQHLVFSGDAAVHSAMEFQVKPERAQREVRRTQSSNNLYAFPGSPIANSMSIQTTADSSQKKVPSPRPSDVPRVTVQTSNQQPSSSSSSTTNLNPSTNSKSTKHAARPNSTSTQRSPRTPDKHSGSNRQKSDSVPAAGAGKSPTVEAIQQRQAQQHQRQALQKQQSVEVSIGKDAGTPPHKPPTMHQSSSVCNMQPPSTTRPSSSTQYQPPHSHQSSSPVTVSPLLIQPPVPAQQGKFKQQVASVSVQKGSQKSPLQSAKSAPSKTAQVIHRQPTPPPVLADSQKSAGRQEKHPKSRHTTATHSTSNYSTHSGSPLPTSTSSGVTSDQHLDDSDSPAPKEVVVSAKTEAKPSHLNTARLAESVDQSNGSSNRSHAQVDSSMSESVELKDVRTSPAPSNMAKQHSFVTTNVDERPYATSPMNGYKTFYNSEMMPVSDGCAPYSGLCSCVGCQQTPFYMSVPPPGSRHPPPSPLPQHQNGIIYGLPSTFLGPSNGMINPGMHVYNRPNNQGAMPNGMVQRGDVLYPQMPYIPANTTRSGYHNAPTGAANIPPHQFQPAPPGYTFYAQVPSYTKRVLQCTNCGQAHHSRNDCPEPFDNTSYKNEYHLDIQPRSEISE